MLPVCLLCFSPNLLSYFPIYLMIKYIIHLIHAQMGTTSTTAVTVPVTTTTTRSTSLTGHNTPTPPELPAGDDVSVESACRVVLKSLKTNLSHADDKTEAMSQMIKLFWNEPKAQQLLTSLGACKAVLDILKRHPEHTGVQQHGMHAMKKTWCATEQRLHSWLISVSLK